MPDAPSKIVAVRLKAARAEAGLSQAQLAKSLGVSQAAISNWESGEREPGVDDLYAVARELDIEVYDLLPRRMGPPLRVALRAVADELDHTSLAADLEAFADEAEALPRLPRRVWTMADAAEDAAYELLEELDVTGPPIDIELVALMCGIPVLSRQFENALSGLVVDTASGPVIGINRDHAPNRQRFSIAHELGHVLLRHLDSFHVDLGTAAEDGTPPGYNYRHERAANDFAASVLMPAAMMRRHFTDDASAEQLALTFEVSPLAMGFRLRNLGLR